MSELEKIKRYEYQRKRKKFIWIQMLIVGILTLATIITSTLFISNNKNAYVGYTEEGKVIYRAYLADNDFYEEEYLNGSHAYVASLINKMTADFSYDVKMEIDNVNFQYTYKIDAQLIVKDKASKTKIYDSFYEVLYEETSDSSGDELNIKKLVEFDYQKFNKKADEFNRTYNLKNTENILLVKMTINVIGMCESFQNDNQDVYTITLSLPLMQTVVSPSVSATVPTGEQKIIVKDISSFENLKISAIVLGCLDLLAIIILVLYIFLSIDKHIDYARKVKKLISNYDSYIQQILTPFDFSSYQVLKINSFKGLLEIRDTLQSPLLMYENEDKTCSQFFITTAEKVLYLYEIEVEEETNINNPNIAINQEIAVTTVLDTAETIETVESVENIAYVTYKKSYTSRLIQAEETLKNNYVIIKQELLAYKKVKARTSWNAETFSAGRIQCAKLTVRGKTLWLNLNLAPNNYVDSKYSIVDCSDKKKFAEVPVAIKIRSNRSVKYALELIRDTMSGLSIIRTDKQQEIITLPYEDTESLIKKGFIKEIYLGKTDKNTSVVKLNVGKMLKHKTENKD
ncbi:MAG: hypothetical protein IKB67_03990 [Clostridia bacterium]|nr:hypothetical protein [Clostridia bacterium]